MNDGPLHVVIKRKFFYIYILHAQKNDSGVIGKAYVY